MVGIGNTFSGAKNDSDGGVESFMPLIYSSKSLPKKAHHKFQNKGTFSFSADDSQLQAFLASLGKIDRTRSKKEISFVIYNDVQRKGGKNAPVYYAKFVEYGYHSFYAGAGGEWREGRRMFARLRKRIKRKLEENLRKTPRIYVLKNLEKAYEDTVIWCVKELKAMTPDDDQWDSRKSEVDRGTRMKDHWGYYKMKGGERSKSKGD